MKKIIIAVLALLLLAGGVTAAKVLAQEFMQVSPRTWVLGSSGIEPIDIHLAVPLKSIINREEVGVKVYYKEILVDGEGNETEKVVVPVEIEESISIGADSRGDLVIKFVPILDASLIGKSLTVKVIENDNILSYNGEVAEFTEVEVKDKDNPQYIEEAIESVVTFLSSIGKR